MPLAAASMALPALMSSLPSFSSMIPLIGSGISSFFGMQGASENRQATEAANLQNAILAQRGQDMAAVQFERTLNQNLAINQQNIDLQREFAKSGISWRVQDAKNAGIHPLAALGGTGASFAPVAHVSGGSIPSAGAPYQADHSSGNAMASMGQDISRALHATMMQDEKTKVYTDAARVADLSNKSLQNELLRSQIARLRQTSTPSMPTQSRYMMAGQGNAPSGNLVENKAQEREVSAPGHPHQSPAAIADISFAKTASGSYMPMPSKDVKERIEDNVFQEAMHFFRNNLMPAMSNKMFSPPPTSPGQGKMWTYNPFDGYSTRNTPFQERFTGRR